MSPLRRPAPADPRVRALVAQANRAQLSRRSFLIGALGTAGAGALLAACGTGSPSGTAQTAKDVSDSDKLVRWANWTQYLDQDEDGTTYPTLVEFEKQSGLKVTYAEDIDDNDAFYGKISGQLKNGQDIGYDIITLTDWMAARLIRLGYTQELDKSRIPNAANILPTLADVDFDPGRAHSLTWQSGFAGFAWDKEKVSGGVHTLSDLWAPELAGRVEVLSEMRDTMGIIMLDQGIDPSGDWSDDDFYGALRSSRRRSTPGTSGRSAATRTRRTSRRATRSPSSGGRETSRRSTTRRTTSSSSPSRTPAARSGATT